MLPHNKNNVKIMKKIVLNNDSICDDMNIKNEIYNCHNKQSINKTQENSLKIYNSKFYVYQPNTIYNKFISKLDYKINDLEYNNIFILPYKICTHNNYSFMSYYLDNNRFYLNDSKYLYDINQQIKNTLRNLTEKFKYMGYLKSKKSIYLLVNINNTEIIGLTQYDIIIQKSLFDVNINNNVVEFFIKNSEIDNLYLNNKILSKPIVYYSGIDEKYTNYVKQYKNTLYIPLNNKNNVRNISFTNNKFNENLISIIK
jgi:hypothetical protein